MEIVAFVFSFAVLAVLALLVGRLFALVIKIALVLGLLYFVLSHLDLRHTSYCLPQAKASPVMAFPGLFCPGE